ncbi:MAG TPA: type II toxin-antitoxin system VapC family toxin [Myxococcota bacterium]|nr:type II toxin-antitoxin system VapC family toxin [Myxococcota bacterium]
MDTNVLVRFLVTDPEAGEQVAAARAVVQGAALGGERVFVPLVSLVETVWVLRRSYKQPKVTVVQILEALLANGAFLVEEGELVAAATRAWKEEPGDFADHVIHQQAVRAGCTQLLSFDAALAGLPGIQSPLRSRL